MKIKSTKNIFREIKGTNTFEVEMVGRRKDLEELRNELSIYGFNFDENGEFTNYYPRTEELIKLVSDLTCESKLNEMELAKTILNNAKKCYSLYSNFKKKDFEFKYILDMNNIEIIIEKDKEGRTTSKAIINLIENEETGQLISWKEIHSDGLDLQTQGTDIRNIGIKSEVGMKMINSKYIDIDKYINQIEKEINRTDSEKSLKLAADMYGNSTKKIMSLCKELDQVNIYLKTLEDLIEMEGKHQDEVYRKMYEISVVDNNK